MLLARYQRLEDDKFESRPSSPRSSCRALATRNIEEYLFILIITMLYVLFWIISLLFIIIIYTTDNTMLCYYVVMYSISSNSNVDAKINDIVEWKDVNILYDNLFVVKCIFDIIQRDIALTLLSFLLPPSRM